MRDTEYGGADTHKTQGIQPEPHTPTPAEQLRLMYATDPDDVASAPDIYTPKKQQTPEDGS